MAEQNHPCGIKDVDVAINYAIEEKDDTYQDLLARLSAKQKALLIALAHAGKNAKPTSGEFIKKYHLSSASAVQRCLSALQEKDIITNHTGNYYIRPKANRRHSGGMINLLENIVVCHFS